MKLNEYIAMISKHFLNSKNRRYIYQNDEWFKFSLDSILLCSFIGTIRESDKIIDLGTGNAPIPIYLSTKTKAKIVGLEIQKEVYDLALRSIEENDLENQITLLNNNIKNVKEIFSEKEFNIIISNPPYYKYNETSYINNSDTKSIARHEIEIKLEEIIEQVDYLLKDNGKFYLVHRAERLIEIINCLEKYSLTAKRIRFVFSKVEDNAHLVLMEITKHSKKDTIIMKPLIIYENNEYTEEIKNIV